MEGRLAHLGTVVIAPMVYSLPCNWGASHDRAIWTIGRTRGQRGRCIVQRSRVSVRGRFKFAVRHALDSAATGMGPKSF